MWKSLQTSGFSYTTDYFSIFQQIRRVEKYYILDFFGESYNWIVSELSDTVLAHWNFSCPDF